MNTVPVSYTHLEVPFMQRMSRMVLRDRNITAIVTWSMGNESGYGKHFEPLYDWTKKFDPTRPVQYEGGGYDAKSDIYCPRYARIWSLRRHVNQRDARPMIPVSYTHLAAMFIRKYSYKAGILLGLGLYAVGALLFFPAKMTGNY